jgi:hypothetical protein
MLNSQLFLLSGAANLAAGKLFRVENLAEIGVGEWGVVELGCTCRPYSAGVLHSVSDQIQNLQNCFTTPNKNDPVKTTFTVVSLKFLRPRISWLSLDEQLC